MTEVEDVGNDASHESVTINSNPMISLDVLVTHFNTFLLIYHIKAVQIG